MLDPPRDHAFDDDAVRERGPVPERVNHSDVRYDGCDNSRRRSRNVCCNEESAV
jgi:hypothetical protein